MNMERVSFLGKHNPTMTLTLAGGLALFVFLVDAFGHFATAIMVLYSIVVMLVATVLSRRGTLIVAIACIVATVIGYLIGHLDEESFSAFARSTVACLAIGATTALTLRIQADSARLAEQVRELNLTHEALNRSTAELAHATRVTMLGELAASIAHEVTQPLAAIVTAGDAASRWLNRPKPALGEVGQSIGQMVRDAKRASDVIRQIRAMAQKRGPGHAVLDLNSIVRESIELVRRELDGARVEVETAYTEPPPLVCGDRVQLQQIVINLVMNGVQAMAGVTGRAKRMRIGTHRFDEHYG